MARARLISSQPCKPGRGILPLAAGGAHSWGRSVRGVDPHLKRPVALVAAGRFCLAASAAVSIQHARGLVSARGASSLDGAPFSCPRTRKPRTGRGSGDSDRRVGNHAAHVENATTDRTRTRRRIARSATYSPLPPGATPHRQACAANARERHGLNLAQAGEGRTRRPESFLATEANRRPTVETRLRREGHQSQQRS